MSHATWFRPIALGIVLAGSIHLTTAEPVHAASSAATMPCTAWAEGYAAGYCAAKNQVVGNVGYMCNDDGTATFFVLDCMTKLRPSTGG